MAEELIKIDEGKKTIQRAEERLMRHHQPIVAKVTPQEADVVEHSESDSDENRTFDGKMHIMYWRGLGP